MFILSTHAYLSDGAYMNFLLVCVFLVLCFRSQVPLLFPNSIWALDTADEHLLQHPVQLSSHENKEHSCHESNSKTIILCQGNFQLIIHLKCQIFIINWPLSPTVEIISHYKKYMIWFILLKSFWEGHCQLRFTDDELRTEKYWDMGAYAS